MTISRDLRDRWAAALRSGKYRQGRLVLRTSKNEYCCLGVLADIIDPTAWRPLGHRYCWREEGIVSFLPEDVGLDQYQGQAVMMNDSNGLSFNEIADWIETLPTTEDQENV